MYMISSFFIRHLDASIPRSRIIGLYYDVTGP